MNIRNIFFIIFVVGLGSNLLAQFSISAEYRPRAEANNGYRTLPVESSETAFYVSQRTRLNFKYNSEKYEAYFSLQDVRVWGQADYFIKSGIQYNSNALDIHQAWFDWHFAKNWSLKTGRQVWSYDDGRMLAGRNWNQYGLAWDAFLLKYQYKKLKIHLGSSINNTWISFNKDNFNPTENSNEIPLGFRIKYFNFLWFNYQFSDKFKISFANYYASFLGPDTKSTYYTLGTSGLHFDYQSDFLAAQANLYYQYGKTPSGIDASAFMATLKAQLNFKPFTFSLNGDYLSGDETTKDSYNAFNILYGARWPVYGWMNYYVLPGDTKNGGLVDLYPGIKYVVQKKHYFLAQFHFFSLSTITFETPELDKNLGNELDFSYVFKYDKDLSLGLYFSYYFATETSEYIKGIEYNKSSSPYWLNLMITFKPSLFSSYK